MVWRIVVSVQAEILRRKVEPATALKGHRWHQT